MEKYWQETSGHQEKGDSLAGFLLRVGSLAHSQGLGEKAQRSPGKV
jgi:hypothetical protein